MSRSHSGKIRTTEHCANLKIKRKLITGNESASGAKNHTARAIVLTNSTGIEEHFECAKDAIMKYNLHQSEVSKCCRGVRTSHSGFKVRYAE